MRVGFTGTRAGMTTQQAAIVRELLRAKIVQDRGSEFHHGDCLGADAQAAAVAASLGFSVVSHPPVIARYRAYVPCNEMREPKPYLVRNHAIVDECELMIATPRDHVPQRRGSGAWATVRYTEKVRRPLWLILPDGDVFFIEGFERMEVSSK